MPTTFSNKPLFRVWPQAAGVFCVLLSMYVLTMPRTITLEDSPNFVTAAALLGIPHCPGYPLYTLLGHAFTWLPFGTVAMRVYLCSAVFGAAAGGVLWALTAAVTRDALAAWIAALAWGLSREAWSQSIVAEVYSMNAFFCFLLLLLAWRAGAQPSRRAAVALAFVFGLSCANHYPLTFLLTPALLVAAWPCRREALRALPLCLLAAAAGLLPYLYLPLRSPSSLFSFLGAVHTWPAFRDFVGRKVFQAEHLNPTAGWTDKLQFAAWMAKQAAAQFTVVGAAVALAGMALRLPDSSARTRAALGLAFLAHSAVLIFLLDFDFDPDKRLFMSAYPLVSYGVMAVWIGVAVAALRGLHPKASAAVLAAAFVLLGAEGMTNYRVNNRRNEQWSDRYARGVLESLPPRATILIQSNLDIGPMMYLHLVEGLRPDVNIQSVHGFWSPDPIAPPQSSAEAKRDAVIDLILDAEDPVYVIGHLPLPFGTVELGLLRRVDRALPESVRLYARPPELEALFDELMTLPCGEQWPRYLRAELQARAVPWLRQYANADDPETARVFTERLRQLDDTMQVGMARLLPEMESLPPGQVLAELEAMEKQQDEYASKSLRSLLCVCKGRALDKLNRREEMLAAFRGAWELLPLIDHPHLRGTLTALVAEGRTEDYRTLRGMMSAAGGAAPRWLLRLDERVDD